MSTEPVPIIIDLNVSNYNHDVDSTQLIHRDSYEKLKKQISADLVAAIGKESVSNNKEEKYPPSSGLVYFIDGTRGAGKSTFLKTAYRCLPNEINAPKKLGQLAYIDPSRIEDNEIILLSVLRAIKDKVEDCHHLKNKEITYKEFRALFKNLAGGLSLFSKDHQPLEGLDAELFLDIGLDKVKHSNGLRKSLHDLLDETCELLGVDALMLAFDDADTKATHAKAVLECIRCYLDTPKLVILVTGDMEMYSILVRDHFFKNLGHRRFDTQNERVKQHYRMVDHLEEQYLLKLFPVQRRHQLRPLWNLLEKPDKSNNFIIKSKNDNNIEINRTPKSVTEEIIKRSLRIKNQSDIDIYAGFLLRQPLRSIFQLFSNCVSFLSEFDDLGKNNNEWKRELSEATRVGLRSIALGALYKKDVDVDAIAANELPALIDAVFDLVVADGDFDTAAYLRPQSKEQQLKASFTALSADVAALCVNNPAASLMYMLAGPGSIALFNSSNLASPEFKKYMGIGKNESALNWASHATSILMDSYHQNTSKPLIKCGVIGVLRRSKIKPDLIQNSYITALNATRSNIYKGKIMPIFFLTLTHVSYPTGAIRTYASILNILGIIEKLLQLKPENNQYNSGSIITKRFISTTISSVKTEYSVKNSDDDIDGDINSNESIDKDEIALLNPVIDATNKWLNEIHNLKSIHPSSILLGKIWNRIYFNFQKTSDYFQGTTKTYDLGLLMDIFAISVLNAFFIEEYDYHLLSTSTSIDDYIFDRTNPLSSPNIFNDRYIKILSTPEIFPFTYLLATCPLITGLIEPTRLNTIITKRESAKNHKNLDIFKIDNSGWDLVKSISIMYKKPPPTPATAPTASPSPSKNKQE